MLQKISDSPLSFSKFTALSPHPPGSSDPGPGEMRCDAYTWAAEGGGGSRQDPFRIRPLCWSQYILGAIWWGGRVASDFATLAQMIAIFLALEKGECVQNTICRNTKYLLGRYELVFYLKTWQKNWAVGNIEHLILINFMSSWCNYPNYK